MASKTLKLFHYGWTINMSPKHRLIRNRTVDTSIPVKLKHYGELTPHQQIRYLQIIFEDLIKTHSDETVGSFELTKEGNVHLHLHCQVEHVGYADDYVLAVIRKELFQHTLIHKICKGSYKLYRAMCYIHKLEDIDEWDKYIRKCQHLYPFQLYSLKRQLKIGRKTPNKKPSSKTKQCDLSTNPVQTSCTDSDSSSDSEQVDSYDKLQNALEQQYWENEKSKYSSNDDFVNSIQ